MAQNEKAENDQLAHFRRQNENEFRSAFRDHRPFPPPKKKSNFSPVFQYYLHS